jgi:ATP-binding cassette, subfamily B, bacterial
VIVNALTIVGIGVVMFALDWRLALIVLIPTPLLAIGTVLFVTHVRRVYRRYWGEWAGISGLLASTISGIADRVRARELPLPGERQPRSCPLRRHLHR